MIIDVEGGTGAGMHAHPAPRGRPCDPAFLPAAPPPALAGAVRPLLHPLSRLLPAEPGQQELRPASAPVVRARAIRTRISPRPSRSGCDRAPTGASATRAGRRLKKLEYVDELMEEIAGERPTLTQPPPRRPVEHADARPWPSITSRSRRATRSPTRRRSTTATCAASSPTIRATIARRRPRPSCGITAPRIRRMVAKWTGEYQLTLDRVLDEMIARCRELKLRAAGIGAAAGRSTSPCC